METRMYEMKAVIMYRINIVWSWKKINCSIIGEAAFCKVKFLQKGIFKEGGGPLLIDFKSSALILPH
jgi:hypothetical protein